jgi:hypothetical protein
MRSIASNMKELAMSITLAPTGSLCVLRVDENTWTVSLCRAPQERQVLRRFETRAAAAEWALAERARRREAGQGNVTIHFPESCPCCGTGLKW